MAPAKKSPVKKSIAAKKNTAKTVKKTTAKKTVVKESVVRVEPVKPRVEKRGMVGPIQAIANFWTGYFNFSGRSTRSEFWFGVLFIFFVNWLCAIFFTPLVGMILNLIMVIPGLALALRRYRDAGLSAWLYFIPYVIFWGMPLFRGSVWQRMLMFNYISTDMYVYTVFVIAFIIMNFVVACLPSKK